MPLTSSRQFLTGVALISILFVGCAQRPATSPNKSTEFGSVANYLVPAKGGEGPELEYCFHYAKRVWELTNLIQERQITPQKAQEITEASLGGRAAQEDLGDLEKFSRDSMTPQDIAGERFIRCSKTLRLPIEARHAAVARSCFGLLRVPRYVSGLKSRGQTSGQVKARLLQANPPPTHKLLNSTVDDVYAASDDDAFNTLSRKIFLSCIVAGGSPKVAP